MKTETKIRDAVSGYRKTAVITGILFIIATAATIVSFYFLGSLNSPDYLTEVSSRDTMTLLGMLTELAWAFSVIGIPIVLLPVLKKHEETLARVFLGLRSIEGVSVILGSIALLVLLSLSREVAAGSVPASNGQTIGMLLLAAREWIFLLGSGIAFSLSAVVLNTVLYRTKLVPRWISLCGLVGAVLALAVYLLQIFGVHPTDLLFLLIGVQEMVFAVWLIIKGFDGDAILNLSETGGGK